jgi:hypothetical protein
MFLAYHSSVYPCHSGAVSIRLGSQNGPVINGTIPISWGTLTSLCKYELH